ncbi:unnamed protein product [Ceutorhynchus assimilis]|uniref:Dicer-2 n=1 Tax=Ceutorhynchus assimilis TaxID=467358 RepID=A0A9N9QFV6_9CUCU|nr:unnamed protein product [Ceutorhynchus assimilis]
MEEDNDKFPPRDYQEALREIAIEKNSIIYLPTGTGKTFIAVLVLKHLQHCRIKYTEGGSISFVVVNTIALVDQHAKCIKDRTTLEVKTYSGDMALDFWPKDKWLDELDSGQVFVMTIQILVNLTNQGFLDLNKVNLIVFDECHRGVSDQPMRQLCKSLGTIPNQPRILGLTATLLNGNCKPDKVLVEVEKLEITYHSQVATVDGLEKVTGFSTNPEEILIVFNQHIPSRLENFAIKRLSDMSNLFQSAVYNTSCLPLMPQADLKPILKEEGFKKIVNTISDVIIHVQTMGIYGGYKSIRAHIIQIERIRKHCDNATLYDGLNYFQTVLTSLYRMFDRAMSSYTEEEKIFTFSSEKVKELIKIFETYPMRSKEELCAIVFTKRRFTAKVIYYILDSLSKASEKFSHIKANFMVGYNANPFNDTREVLYNSKKNKEVLQSFDNKEINVMCSSNVLEEGVDITTCSLVIRFDHPEEYRSYIQSKGRARNRSSLFYMLVEKSHHEKFRIRYMDFQMIENNLNQLLVGKNMHRKEPSQYAIERMYNEDEFPPYYAKGPNSAKVDMISAISLLCQYCSSLPCDKYTSLAPALYYKRKKVGLDQLISVTIVLPTISLLRDPIVGPFVASLKSAKRAAALKACELLHKVGELDDHLLPQKRRIADQDVNFLFKHYPEVKEDMAGTNRNKRNHKKEIPACVKGPLTANTPVWLHIIDLQPVFERREEVNYATFYDIYTSNLCYGFITPNPVPSVCDFPIYISMGTINVSLKRNVSSFSLTKQDILDIKEFNYTIYKEILSGLQTFLISDDGNNAESILVVPLNKASKTIDFDVLREKNNVVIHSKQLTSEERLHLNVTQEGYLGKVVTPWYRDIGSYLVTEVSLNKSAKSEFPNEQYATYEEYYKDKHNVGILNPNQPLLYVKRLSKRINFTKPFGVQNKRKREKIYEELDIYLIPELVVKHDFHATLWIQAHLLPTLISRYSYLFRLEEFRLKMVREMKIGDDQQDLKQPLELDEYLLDYEAHIETPQTTVNVLVSEPKENIIVPSLTQINVNKDHMKKMLDREYPWKSSEEPKDIERDLNVTLFDIDYYELFMCKKVGPSDMILKNSMTNNQREHLALTYFKDYQEKRIELIKEKDLRVGPELCLIYKAMTTAEANDVVNMERLETLGDSFLKLFSSLYIFMRFPQFTEGLATSLKGRLVSNKNLYYLATRKNIGGIMKVNDFQKNDWLSPGFKVPDILESRIEKKETSLASLFQLSIPREEQISGKLSKATINTMMEVQSEEDLSEEGLIQLVAPSFKCNYIGDKKIADCVEALLGAYFKTCGIMGGIKFLEWMGIIPESENLLQMLRAEPPNPILNDASSIKDINYHIPDWQIIENEILGYHFKNRGYLLQALTHSSYSANRVTQSYEKLEFVGDAILDFLITCHIFESCGNLSPGELTDLRSALVNNITFANLVVRYNLHKYLLMINIKLQSMIDRFAGYLDSKQLKMDEDVLILLEEDEAGMKLAEYVDVPKVLGDVFEALAGAIYLDSGKDLEVTWKVFHRLMWKEIETFSSNVPINLVRKLYEWRPDPHPNFGLPVEASSSKVVVPLQFMLDGRKQLVYGFGSNKLMAKKAAAKLALRQLQS